MDALSHPPRAPPAGAGNPAMAIYGPALFWTALALTWPVLGRALVSSLPARSRSRIPHASGIAAGLRSLVLPYLAIITGSVSLRDMGIIGHSVREWIVGAAIAGSLGLAWTWWIRRRGLRLDLLGDSLDEIRWSLYRALGWAWTGSLALGILLDLAASALERVLDRVSREASVQGSDEDRAWAAQTVSTAIVFAFSHNLWLILALRVGAGVPAMVGQRQSHREGPSGSGDRPLGPPSP